MKQIIVLSVPYTSFYSVDWPVFLINHNQTVEDYQKTCATLLPPAGTRLLSLPSNFYNLI